MARSEHRRMSGRQPAGPKPATPVERAFADGSQVKRRAEAIRTREVIRYPDGSVGERVHEHLVVDYHDAMVQPVAVPSSGGGLLKLLASFAAFILVAIGFSAIGGSVWPWWLALLVALGFIWGESAREEAADVGKPPRG